MFRRVGIYFFFLFFLYQCQSNLSTIQGQKNKHLFPHNGTLQINNSQGHVEVILTDRLDLEVLAKRNSSSLDPILATEIFVEDSNDTITIRTNPQKHNDGIDLKVFAPKHIKLQLFSNIGNIKVTGDFINLLITTVDGDIHLNLSDGLDAEVVLYAKHGKLVFPPSMKLYEPPNTHSLQGQLGKGGSCSLMGQSKNGNIILETETYKNLERTTFSATHTTDSENTAYNKEDSLKKDNSKEFLKDKDNEDILKIESELVTLNAVVNKIDEASITNLKKEDFTLYEDGVQQSIAHFKSVRTPFNLVLLLDLSGSVNKKIDLIRNAVRHFIENIQPDNKIAIITFTSTSNVISLFTSDRTRLNQSIKAICKAGDGTNFYDALQNVLSSTLENLKNERNAVVIMSDGVDSILPGIGGEGSITSYENLFEQVKESNAMIFPIYLDTEEQAIKDFGPKVIHGYTIAQSQLKELADISGGTMFRAQRIEDLQNCYKRVATVLRTIYSLGYYPSNNLHDGKFRKIRLRANRNDIQIKTRSGYYARKD